MHKLIVEGIWPIIKVLSFITALAWGVGELVKPKWTVFTPEVRHTKQGPIFANPEDALITSNEAED